MKPEISVIMSVYNPQRKEQFEKAVQSIKDQSFQDWEMIICDDGSDRSVAFIEETAGTDSRIRLIRNGSNKGLGYSLNRCIRESSGDYIARMDADDICRPERLKEQLDFLKSHKNADWCGTDAFLINDGGTWGSRHMPRVPKKKDFLKFSPFIHSSVMFRRGVLTKNHGYKALNRSEDYELFMRLYSKGYRGYNIPKELYGYREDENNYKRRTLSCAVEECVVRKRGFEKLGMLSPQNFAYVIKPVVVSAIPGRIQMFLKKALRDR